MTILAQGVEPHATAEVALQQQQLEGRVNTQQIYDADEQRAAHRCLLQSHATEFKQLVETVKKAVEDVNMDLPAYLAQHQFPFAHAMPHTATSAIHSELPAGSLSEHSLLERQLYERRQFIHATLGNSATSTLRQMVSRHRHKSRLLYDKISERRD